MFKQMLKRFQERQQLRADYWIRMHMSDKDLLDIGITRGEIKSKIYR